MTRLFVQKPLPLPGSAKDKASPGLLNIVLRYFFVRPRYVLTVLQTDQTDLIVWKLMTLSDQQALKFWKHSFTSVSSGLCHKGLLLESLGYV